ncbi:hypothetical protein IGI04_036923 [Brassica rapa subsp. trilocularis]|uniref:Uncharacterized protein n=1 Tax=Brassica rapa subsp. trilocularis TaxID=1813537 RepID=A0ABQ7LIU3_BRACM|nr:hypothetical protein IGI04_036923 [Brassica rapa subsp. trilocularis]
MHQTTSRKSSRRLSGSRLDFLEVVWTSWNSSGLHGSLLTKSPFQNRSECFGRRLPKSSRLLPFQSSGLPESRLDFLEVVWTSWKSSGHPGSRLDFLEVVWTSWKSSDKVFFHIKLFQKFEFPGRLTFQSSHDLTFSRLRKYISKSIAKITSALTRRLPAHIRLLQEHRILNESDPPRIVSFFDSMNHKKCRIKILEWRKKKGKSILGALRVSNWLFMVVRVLMTMAIL